MKPTKAHSQQVQQSKKPLPPHSTAYEASKQSYVDLPANAAVSFTAKADAATLRYTVPNGATGKVEIQVNGKPVANLDLSSKHNWQYLENYEHHKGEDIKIHDTPAADRVARFQFDEVGTLKYIHPKRRHRYHRQQIRQHPGRYRLR